MKYLIKIYKSLHCSPFLPIVPCCTKSTQKANNSRSANADVDVDSMS